MYLLGKNGIVSLNDFMADNICIKSFSNIENGQY